MRTPRTVLILLAGLTLALGGAGVATAQPRPAAAPATPTAPLPAPATAVMRAQLRTTGLAAQHGSDSLCARNHVRCQAKVLTVRPGSTTRLITGTPLGYGADELAGAYGLAAAPKGTGTIALLGTGAYPNLESDLTIYRDTYHLPRCTTASGCLKVVDYRGGRPLEPTTDEFGQFVEEEVSVETALDVQMASAACPTCRILFVQLPWQDGVPADLPAEDVATSHFATGVRTAVRLGAKGASISYGYDVDRADLTGPTAAGLRQPGVALFSSSGDSGFLGDFGQWPQSLPTVISAGGTSLYLGGGGARGYTDVAWAGAGSGCTPGVAPAVGQPRSVSDACFGSRAATDVSAVADPYTGVAVYDSYAPATGLPPGFLVVGGTSASSPLLAGAAVRGGVPKTLVGPNLLYAAKPGTFIDVTIGSNAPPHGCESQYFDPRLCVAGRGWDGPTGLGVPSGRHALS